MLLEKTTSDLIVQIGLGILSAAALIRAKQTQERLAQLFAAAQFPAVFIRVVSSKGFLWTLRICSFFFLNFIVLFALTSRR